MCSKTVKVPSWVGAAGTPVLPGDLRTGCPLCQSVSDWGDTAVHADVAVAAGASFAGDRVGEQGVPDPCSREPVDRKHVVVLEHHHSATCDLVRLRGAPERS